MRGLGIIVAGVTLVAAPALAQSAAEVAVVDSAFQPSEVTVDAGGTVTWTQTGSLPHSVTADDGSFDSHPDCGSGDCMGPGDTFQRTFSEPGTYAYYCRVHGAPGGVGMSGTVVVTAAAEPTAAPTSEPPATEEPAAEEPAAEEPAAEEPAAEEPVAEEESAPDEPVDDDAATSEEAPSRPTGSAGAEADTEDAAAVRTELAETGAPTTLLLLLAVAALAGGITAVRRPGRDRPAGR